MRKHAGSGTARWLLSQETISAWRSVMEGAFTAGSERWPSLSTGSPSSISGLSLSLDRRDSRKEGEGHVLLISPP